MMELSKIDRNFAVESRIEKNDIQFHQIDEMPFKVYGIFKENGKYRRMPESVAKKVNEQVRLLHANTAGGRVRFITDSPYIVLHTLMENLCKISHFAMTASVGFDLYADGQYVRSFVPPFDIENGYEGIVEFADRTERQITINFPLYSDVKEVWIGLQEGSSLKEPMPYKNKKPIVYYGSSITQGACASRPGTCYQAIISRAFHYDYINLGFSSGALAEDEMTEYIKKLDMSLFVYDYDHNAPTAKHLAATHEKMFQAIRTAHKNLPIIFMSRPRCVLTAEEEERLRIIEATYRHAVSSGDRNVYLLTGKALTELCKNEGTVDACHPTDYGFASMAAALAEIIKQIEL